MTIARNVANRTTEQRNKRNEVQMLETDPEFEAKVSVASWDDTTLNREVIRGALATLPDQQREAVWLRVAMEFTDEETAAILKVPVGTVKSWVWRALVRLRNWAAQQDRIERNLLGETR